MIGESHDAVGGVKTRVLRVDGAGPTVLCLHGYADSADTWRPVLTRLARGGHAAVAVDLPGFGQAQPRGRGPIVPQLDAFAEAAVQTWGPVIVVGNSMGAATAVRVAASRPDQVAALVAIDDPLNARHRLARWAYAGKIPTGLWRIVELIRFPPAPLPWLMRGGVARAVFAPGFTADPAVLDALAKPYSTWQAVAELGRQAAQYAQECAAGHSGLTIACPTAVVHGARDRIIPVHSSRVLHQQIPGSHLIVLPRSGHCPQLDDPDAVVDIIEDVIARTPGPADDRTRS